MWAGTNNNVYRSRGPYLHSSLSRTLYERLQMDNEMKNFDKNLWYKCELDQFRPEYSDAFLQLDCDEDTDLFLKNCHEKADWVFTNIFHTLATTFLGIFMTKTSINGLLGRGSMFIFSRSQLERLLDVPTDWKGESVLDVGAGDGKITTVLQNYFRRVDVTEASSVMRGILAKNGFRILELDQWHRGKHKYDVISCLNVLDRCDRPITMLRQMAAKLEPETGRLLVAVVIPFQPYVEFGRNGSTLPEEQINVRGGTFADQVTALLDEVFVPAGLQLVRWTKVPYLCEGNLNRSYYWLTDVLFVFKIRSPIVSHHHASSTSGEADAVSCSSSGDVIIVPGNDIIACPVENQHHESVTVDMSQV